MLKWPTDLWETLYFWDGQASTEGVRKRWGNLTDVSQGAGGALASGHSGHGRPTVGLEGDPASLPFAGVCFSQMEGP